MNLRSSYIAHCSPHYIAAVVLDSIQETEYRCHLEIFAVSIVMDTALEDDIVRCRCGTAVDNSFPLRTGEVDEAGKSVPNNHWKNRQSAMNSNTFTVSLSEKKRKIFLH